jgi:hypothetical protein
VLASFPDVEGERPLDAAVKACADAGTLVVSVADGDKVAARQAIGKNLLEDGKASETSGVASEALSKWNACSFADTGWMETFHKRRRTEVTSYGEEYGEEPEELEPPLQKRCGSWGLFSSSFFFSVVGVGGGGVELRGMSRSKC